MSPREPRSRPNPTSTSLTPRSPAPDDAKTSTDPHSTNQHQAFLVVRAEAHGATTNLYAAGFLVTEQGDLITPTDADPSEGVTGTGTAIFGVHDSNR